MSFLRQILHVQTEIFDKFFLTVSRQSKIFLGGCAIDFSLTLPKQRRNCPLTNFSLKVALDFLAKSEGVHF